MNGDEGHDGDTGSHGSVRAFKHTQNENGPVVAGSAQGESFHLVILPHEPGVCQAVPPPLCHDGDAGSHDSVRAYETYTGLNSVNWGCLGESCQAVECDNEDCPDIHVRDDERSVRANIRAAKAARLAGVRAI